MPPSERSDVRLSGRVLYLTQDLDLVKWQLAGNDLRFEAARPLLDNVSTDEITPAWACYYYDETLGRYCLVGLRGGVVGVDAIRQAGFQVVVSGLSKGCGSSRETAPYSELVCGVQLVFAKSIEKIYGQNAHNIGILTSCDFSLLERLERGESLPIGVFTQRLDAITRRVAEQGGLPAFSRMRLSGVISTAPPATPARAMTLTEKVIARHVVRDARPALLGVPAVRPGDAVFARADVRFSHDYVTAMAESVFRRGFGADATVHDPDSVFAFRDHLVLLEPVLPREHVVMGLGEAARRLGTEQARFCAEQKVRCHGGNSHGGEDAEGGEGAEGASQGICHNVMVEDIALPGQLIVGSDSHTCTAGALGSVAFGIGATDLASAWFTGDVRLAVPESVRLVLHGRLRPGVCAKDLMLEWLRTPYVRSGGLIGKVLEFGGEGLAHLCMDERATLANMAVEGGAFSGIVPADAVTRRFLEETRGTLPQLSDALVAQSGGSDVGAEYAAEFHLELDVIEPTVALPGDPRNGVPLRELGAPSSRPRIDIAYGGSCTGGKMHDMDQYARVLGEAERRGSRVASGVALYLQFGSDRVRHHAQSRGYLDLFRRSGATILPPACGACIRAGPGVSTSHDQVTVSAANRNFPGRSGPGSVYLASPAVVAASAIAGRIVHPDELGY